MMITMQGEHGELSPHHGVKIAKLNIWIRVLLLDGLENSCKARFPTAGEIARANRQRRKQLHVDKFALWKTACAWFFPVDRGIFSAISEHHGDNPCA
jgi:hypothetical protein